MKLIKHFFCGISLLFGLPFTASAQPGTLDSSFDFDGKVITNVVNSDSRIWDLAMRPDGKIIAAGASGPISNTNVVVARYNTDGTIDNSFGTNGFYINNYGAGNDYIRAIELQPDGKIVGAGEVFNGQIRNVLIIRLNSDGTVDSNFGNNGKVVLNPFGVDVFCYDVGLQSNGKIVAQFSIYDVNPDIGLVRLNTDGRIDSSFANAGIGVYDIDGGDAVKNIEIQNDDKIVGVGNGSSSCTMFRTLSDGTLDSTFNSTGIVLKNFGLGSASFNDVKFQSDGKIIVCSMVSPGTKDFLFARFNIDGSIDSSYNSVGYIVVPSSASVEDLPYCMVLQPDDKAIGVAWSHTLTFGSGNYFLTRINTQGNLDSSFGTNGKVITDFTGDEDVPFTINIQPDLKIVAAGETWQNGKWNFSLARYFSGLNVGVIDEPAEHFELSAYPNPASNYINLNYELTNNATVSIAVYDVMGKRIKSYVHNETKIKGMQAEALAVDDLRNGVYILRIETDRAQRGVRFVKN